MAILRCVGDGVVIAGSRGVSSCVRGESEDAMMMMDARVLLQVLSGLLVLAWFPPSVEGVDRKLLPVADGSQDRFMLSGNATSSQLHAEYAEGLAQGRRIVMKFDVSSLSVSQLRGARLYLFGGRGSATPSVEARVYRYSFNGWNDASNGGVPFPADANCTFLAQKAISNLIGADYIGTSQWHEFDIGANLGGWTGDGFLSIAVRNFNSTPGSGISFVSRNSVPWDGSRGKEPYIVFEAWDGSMGVLSGEFPNVDLTGWIVITSGGAARTIPNPDVEGDRVAELVTGSPVTLAQDLDTPAEAFAVRFTHQFRTTTGSLQVKLAARNGNTVVLGTIPAPPAVPDGPATAYLAIDSPALLGLDNARLSFTLDGPAGSRIWLDDIAFGPAAPAGIPALRIDRPSPTEILLAWPDPAPGFALEESSGLAPGGWVPVSTPPTVVDGENRVVVPRAPGLSRFFRLSMP